MKLMNSLVNTVVQMAERVRQLEERTAYDHEYEQTLHDQNEDLADCQRQIKNLVKELSGEREEVARLTSINGNFKRDGRVVLDKLLSGFFGTGTDSRVDFYVHKNDEVWNAIHRGAGEKPSTNSTERTNEN